MGNGKKGWWEEQEDVQTEKGIEKKAPIHRKVAIEKEASKVNNHQMIKGTRKPAGYWTDEIIINELKKIEAELKHFPTYADLRGIERTDLERAISWHGGIVKFRKMFGYELLQKPAGYWTDETIINELKKIELGLRHFPTRAELKRIERTDLIMAINTHGGHVKFRELLGHELLKKSAGYWTDEIIINELKKIEAELKHFPTYAELDRIEKKDLSAAISTHGDIVKFRKLLGHDVLKKPDGYWADEVIINELKKIASKIGNFPTKEELRELGEHALIGAIIRSGGLLKFRGALGYSVSLYEQYRAESTTYSSRRGRNTERLLKNILIDWCKQNGYPEPIYNKKLAINNILEFVCNTGKTIGIDVTNTKISNGNAIRRKYRKKDYHIYVDELWIVVFSNVFGEQDYRKFNEESPDNVRVMSIDVFLKELDISTEEHIISKINAYKNCTFRTKDEFIKRHLNTSLDNYVNNNTGEIK